MRGMGAKRAVHGGDVVRVVRETGRPVLDFSACINPYPPQVSVSVTPEDLAHYPDDSYSVLRETIAREFHVAPGEIALGNGSVEIIRLFCHAFLSPGDRVAIHSPTFGEYEFSSRLAGAVPGNGRDVKVRFLCNPNNPTGHLFAREEVLSLLGECEETGTLLFVDEAFMEISDDPSQSVAGTIHPNLFVLRSLTKSFSVPGVRFGYGIGHADIVARLEEFRPPWNVSAVAEKVAIEAFARLGELAASRAKIARERDFLSSALRDLPVSIEPSRANFLLVHTGRDVADLCADLLRRGILVRDCHSFGLPEAIRIAVRTREENERLVEELPACMR
ncbi:MAG: histidinol-phosphate transaminase [Methanolinea sp.]|nr:histidinol-phosphate transaminase [Methanolinea sp.]